MSQDITQPTNIDKGDVAQNLYIRLSLVDEKWYFTKILTIARQHVNNLQTAILHNNKIDIKKNNVREAFTNSLFFKDLDFVAYFDKEVHFNFKLSKLH